MCKQLNRLRDLAQVGLEMNLFYTSSNENNAGVLMRQRVTAAQYADIGVIVATCNRQDGAQ